MITGGIGICHLFHRPQRGLAASTRSSATQDPRPSVCNALDTVQVHRDVAAASCRHWSNACPRMGHLPRRTAGGGLLEGRFTVCASAGAGFRPEWLALIWAEVVDGWRTMQHIANHSRPFVGIQRPMMKTRALVAEVDSAAVYVNASTRFTDGAQFGLGAEVGLSTQPCTLAGRWACAS